MRLSEKFGLVIFIMAANGIYVLEGQWLHWINLGLLYLGVFLFLREKKA